MRQNSFPETTRAIAQTSRGARSIIASRHRSPKRRAQIEDREERSKEQRAIGLVLVQDLATLGSACPYYYRSTNL